MRGYTLGGRLFGVFALACAVSGIGSGCKEEPSLFGTWESTGSDKVRLTFEKDLTYDMAILRLMDRPVVKGRFKRLENKISFYDSKIDVPGGNLFGGAVGEFMSRGMLEETEFTMTWKTDNEIVLNGDGLLAGAFKRVGGSGQ